MMNHDKRRKERKEFITATSVGDTTELAVEYDTRTDRLILPGMNPQTVKYSTSYNRESNKEKLLNVLPCCNQQVSIDFNKNIINNFDHLCAIDTNTRIIEKRKISITASYHVPGLLRLYKQRIPLLPLCAYLIVDINDEINPEVIGWHLFLKNNIKNDYFAGGRRLGLIVDCKLSNHDGINSHKIPYYRNHILPEYVTLIYASSDTGKEYLPNQLIAFCDKASRQVFDYLKVNPLGALRLSPGDQYFSGFCRIKARNLL